MSIDRFYAVFSSPSLINFAVLCMMINIVIMKLVTTTAMMKTVMTTLMMATLGSTCMMAVRKDCGLKKPGSHTEIGRLKSAVHPSS